MGAPSLIHEHTRRPLVAGRSLFDEADELSVLVPASCRRTGRCHECVVKVVSGGVCLSPRTTAEDFLREPYRLACQATIERPTEDVEFSVLRRRLRILMPPERHANEIVPGVVRTGREVRNGEGLLAVDDLPILGLALDIGTTTIVLELVDLRSGDSVAVAAFENPQRFGGSDVVARIAYDSERPGELRTALRRALNAELRTVYGSLGLDRRAVREAYVVGNPTMRDMFFGLDVQGLGHQPFRSVTEREPVRGGRPPTSIVRHAHELGLLIHPRALVIGGPLIACHVGADSAADLVATGLLAEFNGAGGHRAAPRSTFLMDIGTNTEIVATDGERIFAASCPAGPAFEGGLVASAMPGAEGAIDAVTSDHGQLTYRTIGSVEPEGICGSGLVDLLATLREDGELSVLGRFRGGRREIAVVPERGIGLSTSDVSHLAQAKAANSAGLLILLGMLGAGAGQMDRLFLAGGFANSLDIRNAIAIGLLPPVAEDRVIRAGNAAISGATALLLSTRLREQLETLCARIEHVQLELDPAFFDAFVDGCRFEPLAELVRTDRR